MDTNQPYRVVRESADLPKHLIDLVPAAKHSIRQAYAPYSGFLVGTSLLLDNAKVVSGANQENVSFPLCMCAERVALYTKSMLWPENSVVAMAIYAKNTRKKLTVPAAPCGACRQVIQEYVTRQGSDFEILLCTDSGPFYLFDGIKKLLPMGFTPGYLLDSP